MDRADTRKRLAKRIGLRLRRADWPRIEMSLMVAGTGAAGFVVSFLLLHAGLGIMWLRYVLSVVLAYAAFLGLLRFWLWRHLRRDGRSRASSRSDALDLVGDLGIDLGGGGSGSADSFSGGGGRFGGGGASGSLDGMQAAIAPRAVEAPAPAAGGKSGFLSGFNLDCDCDEAVVIIALVAVVAGVMIASLWIIITAPTLLGELMVDGLLVSGLYRRMKNVERQSWLHTAFDRTVIPFAVLAVLFGLLGWALQNYAPEARSLGDAWISYRSRHPG
jgi:hypothetical protein